jgi:hypothetical protein
MRIRGVNVIAVLCLALLSAGASIATASAQNRPARFKVDGGVGLGHTSGGTENEVKIAVAFSAVAAVRLRTFSHGALVAALAVTRHAPLDFGTSCTTLINGPPGCLPHYPIVDATAALLGWETTGDGNGGSARVSLGPARVRTRKHGDLRLINTFNGVQGRADIAAMPSRHLGFLAWLQAASPAPFRNRSYMLLNGGFGLRVQ